MKFLSILAAASLALAPAIASAGSHGDSTESTANSRPISGPLAGQPVDDQEIGVIPIWIGFGMAAVAAVALLMDDDDAVTSTTTTNGAN